jgi:YVTN family beta-propeller protein
MFAKLLCAALLSCLVVNGATIPTDRLLPGMPPILDPHDIYSADHAGNLSPVVKNFPPRIYVPNTESNTVSVIDPATYKLIETLRVGRQPQRPPSTI